MRDADRWDIIADSMDLAEAVKKRPTIQDARRGRQEMRKRCAACALQSTPDTIKKVHIRKDLRYGSWDNGQAIQAPRPVTRRALFAYLSAIAHATQGNCSKDGFARACASTSSRFPANGNG